MNKGLIIFHVCIDLNIVQCPEEIIHWWISWGISWDVVGCCGGKCPWWSLAVFLLIVVILFSSSLNLPFDTDSQQYFSDRWFPPCSCSCKWEIPASEGKIQIHLHLQLCRPQILNIDTNTDTEMWILWPQYMEMDIAKRKCGYTGSSHLNIWIGIYRNGDVDIVHLDSTCSYTGHWSSNL